MVEAVPLTNSRPRTRTVFPLAGVTFCLVPLTRLTVTALAGQAVECRARGNRQGERVPGQARHHADQSLLTQLDLVGDNQHGRTASRISFYALPLADVASIEGRRCAEVELVSAHDELRAGVNRDVHGDWRAR